MTTFTPATCWAQVLHKQVRGGVSVPSSYLFRQNLSPAMQAISAKLIHGSPLPSFSRLWRHVHYKTIHIQHASSITSPHLPSNCLHLSPPPQTITPVHKRAQHTRNFCYRRTSTRQSESTPLKLSQRRACSQSTTYVSKHFNLADGDVERYLDRHGLLHRCTKEHAIVQICPMCPSTKGKHDNMYKLYILRKSGVFKCHRCQSQGTWFDLKQNLSFADEQIMSMGKIRASEQQLSSSSTSSQPSTSKKRYAATDSQTMYYRTMWNKDEQGRYCDANRYLNSKRGLTNDVLKMYGVGTTRANFFDGESWAVEASITFPMQDDSGSTVRHKVRSVENKRHMKLEPKGGEWGIFGLNTVPPEVKEVVLTEGELDAMSVYQATGRAAISVPNGASSLPIHILPLLERFERIVLWMDEDEAGQSGAKQFARKLGMKRCVVVRGGSMQKRGVKDGNDCLLAGLDMTKLIDSAKAVQHEGVIRFDDLREEVYAEMTDDGSRHGGVKCVSLPKLNMLLKGHRGGEMTIVSGHTGVGKTTLLAQMSLDYSLQGMGTLWGSFEIANVRLAQKLLQQFHAVHGDRRSLVKNFDYWADRFSEIPMFFMKYHGCNPVRRIVDVMEYANYALDCRHMVLDNLQFMTYGTGEKREERGRFEVMDEAVGELRQFATTCNAHVTLVVHPRKTDDDCRIQIASVYGSAKATQEADNVLALQRTERGKELEVLKNRFDGAVGSIALRFDKKRLLYCETDSSGEWALPSLRPVEPDAPETSETSDPIRRQPVHALFD